MPRRIYKRTKKHRQNISKTIERLWAEDRYPKHMRKGWSLEKLGHKTNCQCPWCKAFRGEHGYWFNKKRPAHSKRMKGRKRLPFSKEWKEKLRKASKKRWQDKEYRNKMIKAQFKGMKLKPNKPEKLLNKLLQKILSNEYKINVKADIMTLAGYIPDFVNINGQKKVIELYGDYWHNRKGSKEYDKKRIELFKEYGYDALVIWEHELKDSDRVANKILIFNNEKRV